MGISIAYIMGIRCSTPKSAFSACSDSSANIFYLKIHDSKQRVLLKKVEHVLSGLQFFPAYTNLWKNSGKLENAFWHG